MFLELLFNIIYIWANQLLLFAWCLQNWNLFFWNFDNLGFMIISWHFLNALSVKTHGRPCITYQYFWCSNPSQAKEGQILLRKIFHLKINIWIQKLTLSIFHTLDNYDRVLSCIMKLNFSGHFGKIIDRSCFFFCSQGRLKTNLPCKGYIVIGYKISQTHLD